MPVRSESFRSFCVSSFPSPGAGTRMPTKEEQVCGHLSLPASKASGVLIFTPGLKAVLALFTLPLQLFTLPL